MSICVAFSSLLGGVRIYAPTHSGSRFCEKKPHARAVAAHPFSLLTHTSCNEYLGNLYLQKKRLEIFLPYNIYQFYILSPNPGPSQRQNYTTNIWGHRD
jgi:hypothetical protein